MNFSGSGMPMFNGIPMFSGLPLIPGSYYFVDAYEGSDSVSTKANSLTHPWLTFDKAYTACTTGKGDGIVLISRNTGTTANTTQYLTAEYDWAKHGITMVGLCAPTRMYQRARIANDTSTQTLTYLLDIQGDDNRFYNMSMFNGGSDATAVGGLKVTGNRNYFWNVNAMGAGHATPGATVDANNLYLSGADENTFEDCVFGTDTVSKVGTLATGDISFANGCARNFFIRCMTLSMTTSGQTAHGAIKLVGGGDAITRNQYFDACKFENYNEGALSAQSFLVIGTAPNNGKIILTDPSTCGYTAYETGTATVYVNSAAGAATGGISAAG